jgi:type IV secretory pathway TrbL component
MADEKPDQENALNKVARTVGTALGTVASTVNGMVGDNAPDPATGSKSSAGAPPQRAGKKSAAGDRVTRAHDLVKEKRAKHRRKLHRKTRG